MLQSRDERLRQCTHAGLVRAKERGRVLGRPAKLTTEQKRVVRDRLGEGTSISALAREYAVSRLTIQRARDGTGQLSKDGG